MSENNNMKNDETAKQQKPGRGPGRGHAMGMPVEKAKDFKGTVKRLVGYLAPKKMTFIVVIIFATLSTIFSIVTPKILGMAMDRLFEAFKARLGGQLDAQVDYTYIGNILLILMGLYVISSLFSYVMQYIMASVAQRTVYDMRQEISHKFTKLPLKYYDGRTHGEVLSRVTNDMDNIANTLQQSLTQLITSVITIIGSIVMMLVISPVLTLIALISIPISVFVVKAVAKRSQKYFKVQQKVLGELNGHVEEMFTGHKEVKAFGYEDKSISKFDKVNNELYTAGWKAQFISGIIMPAMNFINNISYVLIAVVGGIMVTMRIISIGDIYAFFQYSKQFGQPIVQTANIANLFQSTIASAERVFEVLDETEEVPDDVKPNMLTKPNGKVTFDHVRFGYKEDDVLITDMSIHVNPGQTVAIVGPTGAGKTTLVNLLMRFYELDGGSISIDDIDTRSMARGDLRNLFGMVLQDTWLFKGTIRENIAYACEKATLEDVIIAAKAAHADHFIRTLPEGYDTVLNEEANNISQGQKQLLTIARVILANPSILILDEATSSVDTRTELQIQKAMDNLMEDRTSFVIAHRLSTIKDADVILVMNDGDIIETGSHSELLDLNGFYAELYNAQFKGRNKAS